MLKILFATVVYIIVLFIISPVLDHAFSPLDEEESDLEIMLEIIGQIIALTIVWYIASEYFIVEDFKENPLPKENAERTYVDGMEFIHSFLNTYCFK